MSNLRLTQPNQGTFGIVIWLVTGAVLFGVLYMMSAPRGAALRELSAAGPDGVTAFFASPEAAVRETNELLETHAWERLGRYYDFTGSIVPEAQRKSGAYFAGGLPALDGEAAARPFPVGWRFLYSEPAPAEDVVRVVVAPAGTLAPKPEETKSFLMRRFPEGYRLIPEDAAERLPAGPSVP
ncbi:MAG: hypothetical protein U1E87_05755 [Alphaproteobacteria bacterium]